MKKVLWVFLLLCVALPVSAQTVLFDGITNGQNRGSVLLVPAVVTGNDYSTFAKFDYGVTDRFNLFMLGGGRFNGGGHGFGGAGWSGNFYQQTSAFPLNFGFFNSFVFPIETGGPNTIVTLAPIFSHSIERSSGGRITPYGGVGATMFIGGRGTNVNGILGVKLTQIASRWDFIAELQPGERNQFAAGFVFRF